MSVLDNINFATGLTSPLTYSQTFTQPTEAILVWGFTATAGGSSTYTGSAPLTRLNGSSNTHYLGLHNSATSPDNGSIAATGSFNPGWLTISIGIKTTNVVTGVDFEGLQSGGVGTGIYTSTPTPSVAGNTLFLYGHNAFSATGARITAITDTQGNLWSRVTSTDSEVTADIWWTNGCAGGTNTITVTVLSGVVGFGNFSNVSYQELSGIPIGATPSIQAKHLLEYESIALNERTVIGTGADGSGLNSLTNDVVYWNSSGVTTNIFNPSPTATDVRGVDSRDYEYFADGVQADLLKWTLSTPGSTEKWGIAAPTTPIAIGPATGGGSLTFALTAAANHVSANTTYTGPGDLSVLTVGTQVQIGGFVNAGNNGSFTVVSSTGTTVTVNNGSGISESATATLTTQNKLRPTTLLNGWAGNAHVGSYEGGVNQGFSFGLDPSTTGTYSNPNNAFDGDISTFASATGQHSHLYKGCVWSFSAISQTATNVTLNILSEVPSNGTDGQIVTLRSAGLWYSIDSGSNWTQIYDTSSFSKKYSTVAIPNGTNIANVQVMAFMDSHDDMYHKVYDIYIQATFTGSGPVSLVSGRKYFAVFENSTTGHISDLSPVSSSTGAVFGGSIPLVSIPTSTDPQVDTVIILATAAGGDETTLYFVASLPIGTATFQDNTPEENLLQNNTYVSTDEFGVEHGVTNNTPPPNGFYPTKHRGRLFMLQGSTLFFSKSISDLTTSTGLIAGKYEEAWPASFTMDISEGAEQGNSLLSDGTVLYIGTKRHVRRLLGSSPEDFTPIEIVHGEVGVNSQDVWQFIYLEGVPVGAMWMTPDQRVIRSDFNTYDNVGLPIQATLNTINTSALQSCWATFVGEGAFNFYVLAIPTGSNTVPDTLCVYDIARNRWFIWNLADSILSSLYYMNLTGIPRWLICSSAGIIYLLDPSVAIDSANDNPTHITSVLQTSWLDMTDNMLFKALNELELGTDDLGILTTVEGATTARDFETPHVVVTNAPLTTSFLGQLKVYLGGADTSDRMYRFTFTSTSTDASTVLDVIMDYLSIEAIPVNRY